MIESSDPNTWLNVAKSWYCKAITGRTDSHNLQARLSIATAAISAAATLLDIRSHLLEQSERPSITHVSDIKEIPGLDTSVLSEKAQDLIDPAGILEQVAFSPWYIRRNCLKCGALWLRQAKTKRCTRCPVCGNTEITTTTGGFSVVDHKLLDRR